MNSNGYIFWITLTFFLKQNNRLVCHSFWWENNAICLTTNPIELFHPIGQFFYIVLNFNKRSLSNSSIHICEHAQQIIVRVQGCYDVSFKINGQGVNEINITLFTLRHPFSFFQFLVGNLFSLFVKLRYSLFLFVHFNPGKRYDFFFTVIDGYSAVGIMHLMITGIKIRDFIFKWIAKQIMHFLFQITSRLIFAYFIRNHI